MKQFLLMSSSAFFGAVIAILLIAPTPLQAEGKNMSGLFQIYNKNKQRVALIGPAQQQQGSFFLFNEKGKTTHQLGTYGAGAEKGQSLMGMHDRDGSLRYLFRLHGQTDSPVLVMKDKSGYDKLIIGLKGANETPYIQYIDSKGQTKNLIPQY